jgi:hypothetical protein
LDEAWKVEWSVGRLAVREDIKVRVGQMVENDHPLRWLGNPGVNEKPDLARLKLGPVHDVVRGMAPNVPHLSAVKPDVHTAAFVTNELGRVRAHFNWRPSSHRR